MGVYEWINLPKYNDSGAEITYEVVETSAKVETNTELLDNGATMKATHDADTENKPNERHLENTLPTINISGSKTWVDTKDTHDVPALTLTRKSEKEGSTEETLKAVSEDTKTVFSVTDTTAGTGVNLQPVWTDLNYSYSDLPKYDAEGYLYTYTVTEDPIEDYKSEESSSGDASGFGKNFVNTELTSFEATKNWAPTPADVTKSVKFKLVRYKADGTTLDTTFEPVALDGSPDAAAEIAGTNGVFGEEKEGWKYEWTKLVKSYTESIDTTEGGKTVTTTTKYDYVYKVEEMSFKYDGVTYNVSGNATDGYTVVADTTATGYDATKAHAYWKTTKEQDTFTNTLDETTFTAIKLWKENDIAEVWPTDAEITLELTRKKREVDTSIDTTIGTEGKYTIVIGWDSTESKPKVNSVTPTLPTGASATIEAVENDGTNGYTISIKGLEKSWKDTTTTPETVGDYVYFLKETGTAGFNVSYLNSEGVEQQGAESARNGQTIRNSKYSVSLPSTGGPGTTGLYIVGSILTLLALVLLITKKRTEGQGID